MGQSLMVSQTNVIETSFGRIRVWEHGPSDGRTPVVFLYRHLFRLAALPGVVTALAKVMSLPAFATSRFGYGAVISRMPERALEWVRPLASNAGIRRDLGKLMAGSSNYQTLWAARYFESYDRPVLVVWAEHDRLFPRWLGTRLARAFPQGRCEVVADSATFIPLDRPDRLAALLDEFLSGSCADET
jgi:pimeloyl-ACP methyl ester carboxylesterase